MGSAIHIRTKVLPGRKIEVPAGDLAEGQQVDVFVVVPAHPSKRRRSVLQMLKSTPAPGLFKTPEEVDRYLREERTQWDR